MKSLFEIYSIVSFNAECPLHATSLDVYPGYIVDVNAIVRRRFEL